MKDIFKCIIMSITLLCGIMAINVNDVKADENGKCNINILYSSNISATENDNFKLEIKGPTNIQMEIKANELKENPGAIQLPYGTYQVVSVTYVGQQNIIKNEGYGVSSEFTIRDYSDADIYLAIGQEQSEYLVKNYSPVLMNSPFYETNGMVKNTSGDDSYVRGSESETASDQNDNNEAVTLPLTDQSETVNTGEESQSKIKETPAVKHYKQNDNTSNKSLLHSFTMKLIPIGIIFVIGLIIIVIMYKKQKIA